VNDRAAATDEAVGTTAEASEVIAAFPPPEFVSEHDATTAAIASAVTAPRATCTRRILLDRECPVTRPDSPERRILDRWLDDHRQPLRSSLPAMAAG
jgi:hypothetical protein